MKKYTSALFLVLSLLIALSSSVSYADGYVGALGGASFLNNNVGTKANFGVDAIWKIDPTCGLGVYATYTPLGDLTGLGGSANAMAFLAQGKYWLMPGFSINVKAGLGTSSITPFAGATSTSTSNFAFGGGAGYDYVFTPGWSIGGEANYIDVTSTPSMGAFNLLASLKYWF